MVNANNIQIILAPLQGFTDVTYRNVFCDHFSGLDEAIAPFIATMGQMRLKPSRIRDVLLERNKKLPVIPQILGNIEKDFIYLANYLYDMGHEKINWNLGCPHSKIAKKQRGSGLLCHPEKIDRFLDTIMPAMSGSLSVKIRLGRTSKNEIDELLPVLDRYPLEEIILHPRTGVQMYTGMADHDAFIHAAKQSRHAFTYNGDIVDVKSFRAVQQKLPGIHRFMVGRGMLANPFLAEDVKGIGVTPDRVERLKAFHDDLFSSYKTIFSGPGHLTGRMKGFWTYLGPSFKMSQKPLKKILKSGSLKSYQLNVAAFFDAIPDFSCARPDSL